MSLNWSLKELYVSFESEEFKIDMNRLTKNTLEKSSSSASFFCIRALPNPLTTKSSHMLIKMVTIATSPKSSGTRILARIIDTMNPTIWFADRSK